MTFLKRLMQATVVLALLGICIEVILRMSGIAPTQSLFSVDLNTYQQVPGIWEPGQDLIWSPVQALPHQVKTNSSGYRGAEFSREKETNELRVFLAGDSFTFGTNVNEAETLPYMLQQELKKSCINKRLSLINAGIPGSTIKTHSEMIKRGMQLEPDVIILVFNESDVNDMADPLWDRMTENRNAKGRFPLSLFWPVLRNTATWGLVSNLHENSVSRQMTENVEVGIQRDNNRTEFKNAYLIALKNLVSQIKADGNTFMIATYPGYHITRGRPFNDSMKWAMQEFPKLGVPTIDLLEPLQQTFSENTEKAYLLPDDGHPSKFGHQLAGATIANWLLTQPPIKSRCTLNNK